MRAPHRSKRRGSLRDANGGVGGVGAGPIGSAAASADSDNESDADGEQIVVEH